MTLLPPSTNADYPGAPLAAHFLGLVGILTVVPGAIHRFLPDGGAGVIAGIDLSQNGAAVIRAFAWAGATQIVWGVTLVAASLRYRSLVPLLLALLLVERGLIAATLWLDGAGHRPPAAYATLGVLPLLAVALWLSLRRRRAGG
jgi:hypothetical protein